MRKGKTYMPAGYFYAPYIPMMSTEYLKKWEKTAAAQVAAEMDKDILDRIMKITPITWKHGDMIILKKRNRKPNNRLVL